MITQFFDVSLLLIGKERGNEASQPFFLSFNFLFNISVGPAHTIVSIRCNIRQRLANSLKADANIMKGPLEFFGDHSFQLMTPNVTRLGPNSKHDW